MSPAAAAWEAPTAANATVVSPASSARRRQLRRVPLIAPLLSACGAGRPAMALGVSVCLRDAVFCRFFFPGWKLPRSPRSALEPIRGGAGTGRPPHGTRRRRRRAPAASRMGSRPGPGRRRSCRRPRFRPVGTSVWVVAKKAFTPSRRHPEHADRLEFGSFFPLGAAADQLRTAVDVLVAVRDAVGVAIDERFRRGEEGAAVVGQEEPVDAAHGVRGRRFAVDTAGDADDRTRLGVVPVHHQVFVVVVRGDRRPRHEGHPVAVEGDVDPFRRPAAFHAGDEPRRTVPVHVQISLPGDSPGPFVQLLGGVEVDFAAFPRDRECPGRAVRCCTGSRFRDRDDFDRRISTSRRRRSCCCCRCRRSRPRAGSVRSSTRPSGTGRRSSLRRLRSSGIWS